MRRYVCFHAGLCAVLLAAALLLVLPWKSDAAVRMCGNAAVTVLLLSGAAAPASVAVSVVGWRRMRRTGKRFLFLLAPMICTAGWMGTLCALMARAGGV